jgi:hypothetical protein
MGVLSTNYSQIVPGALISASYVSDIYDVLMGTEPEAITLSGSLTISGSAIATRGFTGSLHGTASYALTASYVHIQVINSSSAADVSISSSYAATASFVKNAQTASYAVSASYAPFTPTSWSDIYNSSTGTVFYVSPSGSNSYNGLSSVKPLQTLYAAKTAATSGSVVYVMSGVYEFNNRSTTGYQWNGRTSEINLWKNGVTYYFEPGCKIIFHNETPTGERLALFNTSASIGEACTVLGELEFEQNGYGSDTSNGLNNFFYAPSTDSGYTFFAKVKKLTSNHCQLIDVSKSNTTSTIGRITIISEEEVWRYNAGQTGAPCFAFFAGNGTDSTLICNIQSRHRDYQFRPSVASTGNPFQVRNTHSTSSHINFSGNTCYVSSKALMRLRALIHKDINVNINKIYYDYSNIPLMYGMITQCEDASSVSNFVLNINGDLIDYSENSYSSNGLFEIISPNSIYNFTGNIYTRTTGGTGRFIVKFRTGDYGTGYAYGNQVNLNANIYLLGSSATTSELFYNVNNSNTINFTGRVYGNYQNFANINAGGTLNINNANIESTATSSGVLYLHSADTTLSRINISNSKIKMLNSDSYMANGHYYNVVINNSNIVNSGTAFTLYNSVNSGKLQILNSSVYASTSSLAINYTSSIITSNTVINTVYSGSLTGSLTTLPEMIL